MGAEIGLVPMNQISQSSQSQHRHKNQLPQQPNPNPINTAASSSSSSPTSWMMWNPTEEEEEEESWEVRAFAEDTRNIMGTTWPPRSYTCTFCRREFRSAQALGGHMNVHRRDRARLHQAHHHQPGSVKPTSSPALVANAGLCLLYHLPSPNTTTVAAFTAPTNNINGEEYTTQYSPSTLLPISSSSSSYPVPNNNLNMMMQTCSSPFQAMPHPIHHSSSSYCCNNNYSSRVDQQQPATSTSIDNGHLEELDLELRLGHKPPPT